MLPVARWRDWAPAKPGTHQAGDNYTTLLYNLILY